MGRSTTPTYAFRIETFLSLSGKVSHTSMAWKKEYGKPTTANIDKWVTAYEESCKPGGCNAHLGIDPVVSVEIKRNVSGGEVVATWERKKERPNEPMFQQV
jgi:hypothetical protein